MGKEQDERAVFEAFAKADGLPIDAGSIQQLDPPNSGARPSRPRTARIRGGKVE